MIYVSLGHIIIHESSKFWELILHIVDVIVGFGGSKKENMCFENVRYRVVAFLSGGGGQRNLIVHGHCCPWLTLNL